MPKFIRNYFRNAEGKLEFGISGFGILGFGILGFGILEFGILEFGIREIGIREIGIRDIGVRDIGHFGKMSYSGYWNSGKRLREKVYSGKWLSGNCRVRLFIGDSRRSMLRMLRVQSQGIWKILELLGFPQISMLFDVDIFSGKNFLMLENFEEKEKKFNGVFIRTRTRDMRRNLWRGNPNTIEDVTPITTEM